MHWHRHREWENGKIETALNWWRWRRFRLRKRKKNVADTDLKLPGKYEIDLCRGQFHRHAFIFVDSLFSYFPSCCFVFSFCLSPLLFLAVSELYFWFDFFFLPSTGLHLSSFHSPNYSSRLQKWSTCSRRRFKANLISSNVEVAPTHRHTDTHHRVTVSYLPRYSPRLSRDRILVAAPQRNDSSFLVISSLHLANFFLHKKILKSTKGDIEIFIEKSVKSVRHFKEKERGHQNGCQ